MRLKEISGIIVIDKPENRTSADVTNKLKKIEYELRRNQQTVERILQSSPDPIIVTDLDYRIVKFTDF